MADFRSTEELLAWLVDFIAVRFGSQAILKGGMALRLLQSQRFTNDVDLVMVPFRSKRDAESLIVGELRKVEGLEVEGSMNSKALRLLVRYGGWSGQLEVSAKESCPSEIASTGLLSSAYGLPPRAIRIMALPEAFAHKMAAWNERRLLRDVYDLYLFKSVLQVSMDLETLDERLEQAKPNRGKHPARSRGELAEALLGCAKELDDRRMDELRALLPESELVGLAVRLQAALGRIASEL
jgi:predicted nucleotidyltransferase component of viral defense system